MSEIKLQAGQWYRTRGGEIRYCIGASMALADQGDKWVIEDQDGRCGVYHNDGSWVEFEQNREDIVEHLPDCDSFNWVPPPKLKLREGAWYERKDGKIVGPCKPYSGAFEYDAKWTVGGYWYRDDGTNLSDYRELVREVDPPKPNYRPFQWKDRERLRDKWISLPSHERTQEIRISYFILRDDGTWNINGFCPDWLYKNAKFVDGTPFGVLDK